MAPIMKNLGFKLLHLSNSKQKTKQQYLVTCCYAQQNAGFTLLEVLVVLLMVGVLSAIAAPGWIGFCLLYTSPSPRD